MSEQEKIKQSQEDLKNEFVLNSLQQLKKISDFYQESPTEGELDLVALVRADLFSKGVDEGRLKRVFDHNPFVVEAKGRHTHAQQFQLCRWLNQQFEIVQVYDNIPTQLERYQVIFGASIEEWIKIWREGLLIRLRELDLPRTLNNER